MSVCTNKDREIGIINGSTIDFYPRPRVDALLGFVYLCMDAFSGVIQAVGI